MSRTITILLIASLLSLPAAASELPDGRSIRVEPAVEIPAVLLGVLLWSTPMLIEDELPNDSLGRTFDRSKINPLDRALIGSPMKGARLTSDILSVAAPVLVFSGALVQLVNKDWEPVIEDAVIILEAMVLTGITNQLVRHAFERPRPYMYLDSHQGVRFDDAEDIHSFFSGHTATAFAAVTSFAMLSTYRRPGAVTTGLAWGLGMGMGAGMAAFRVLARDHHLTDVVVGAAVGTAFGLLIPWLHVKGEAMGVSDLHPVLGPRHLGVGLRF